MWPANEPVRTTSSAFFILGFGLFRAYFWLFLSDFCDYNIAFGVLRSGSVTHDTLNVAYATVVCTTCYRMFRERYTERWNGFGEPRVHRAWDRGACKPPSVAIRSLHNVINRYLAVTRPMEVESLSGGNIDIITFLARHSEREIFPQDVERRFGITRSTSSRVLALMERKRLIVRESVPRDARLKKNRAYRQIARHRRSAAHQRNRHGRHSAAGPERRRDPANSMHVLDVMQTNLVSTGLIGDESRYSSLALCEAESRERQSRECESQPTVRKTSQEDETGKEE